MADTITEQMRAVIIGCSEAIRSQNAAQISTFYESGGLKFSEKSKQVDWPSVEAVSSIVSDEAFILLYKEMYYRHMMANPKMHQLITIEQRVASFNTYTELFNHLLNREDNPNLDLPAGWVWDIVDEFIYQFQEFYQYRCNRLRNPKGDDVNNLKSMPEVWNVHTVLKFLHAFRDKSEVLSTLAREAELLESGNISAAPVAAAPGSSIFSTLPLYKLFGTYSLIGLLRVHCLLGDYYLALKSVSALQPLIKKHPTFPAPKITLYYYTGFSYMMMRRYADAIRTFSHILHWLSRFKNVHSKTYQTDDTNKKNEQMYALLAILITYCPQRLDEHVNTTLRDNYADKMAQMARGDMKTVEDYFSYASPKWVSPISEGDAVVTANVEMTKLQTKLFVNEINQQMLMPTIRSYLKLYTTIDIAKLSSLIQSDKDISDKIKVDAASLTKALQCYTHKTRGLVTVSGQSSMTSFSDVSFYVDNDMIHIFDAKAPRRFGAYFTRKIVKLEDLITDLTKEQS